MAVACNRDDLVDLQKIHFRSDTNALANARIFLKEVRDPYLFKVDDIIVHVEFCDSSQRTLQQCIENLLSRNIVYEN